MTRRFSALTAVVGLLALLGLTVAQSSAAYVVDGDGSVRVNIMRHYNNGGLTTTFQNINGTGVGTSSTRPISGDQWMMQWNDGFANPNPTATGTLRFTLKEAYLIKKFVHHYGGHVPDDYVIRVSTTGFNSMTTAVTQTTGSTTEDLLTTPVLAKFIEYTWTGTTASPFVLMKEFEAYADASELPRLTPGKGFDLLSMPGVTITNASTGDGGWVDALGNVLDRTPSSHLDTFIRGLDNSGPPRTDDAVFIVDLNQITGLSAVNLGFFHGQGWGQGAKIELSVDGTLYNTVFDTNSGVDLVNAVFPHQQARFIRVTNKSSEGGAMVEIQAFVPEPATATLLGLAGLGFARRRRA